MANFYAVKVGIRPGVYTNWEDCKQQVNGYPGAIFKKFSSRLEAEKFYQEGNIKAMGFDPSSLPESYAFVDGSYNPKTHVYGCGGFLVHNGKEYIIQSNGNDPEMAKMRNVAGELLGAKTAIWEAIELGVQNLTIFYDYSGIEKWATGEWKAEKDGTKVYCDFIRNAQSKINISFVHTPGHSGIEGNEEADRLAKEAVSVKSKTTRKKKEIWVLVSCMNRGLQVEPFSTHDDAVKQMVREFTEITGMIIVEDIDHINLDDFEMENESYFINAEGAQYTGKYERNWECDWKIVRVK